MLSNSQALAGLFHSGPVALLFVLRAEAIDLLSYCQTVHLTHSIEHQPPLSHFVFTSSLLIRRRMRLRDLGHRKLPQQIPSVISVNKAPEKFRGGNLITTALVHKSLSWNLLHYVTHCATFKARVQHFPQSVGPEVLFLQYITHTF